MQHDMKVLQSKAQLQAYIAEAKNRNQTIGFAPTMGALHAGHISLFEKARTENDVVVASIFVNPTQFNNPDDLEKYPRTVSRDIGLLEKSGAVDAVYVPEVTDLYPDGPQSRHYDFGGIENEMEGKARPGHFDGVGTVVETLFTQVQPDNAYFGEKDFQQLAIIRKLVETKNLPVKIHGVAIYREQNGLAMSSRNERLSPQQKEDASIIYETLLKVRDWFRVISVKEINERVKDVFKDLDGFSLEYFTIADSATLKETDFFYPDHHYRAFIVVNVGNVRLIDNMDLGTAQAGVSVPTAPL